MALGTWIKEAVEAPNKGPEEDSEQYEHGGDREHVPPYPDVGLSSRRLLDQVALTTSSVTHGGKGVVSTSLTNATLVLTYSTCAFSLRGIAALTALTTPVFGLVTARRRTIAGPIADLF